MWKVVLIDLIGREFVETDFHAQRTEAIEVAFRWSIERSGDHVAVAVPSFFDVLVFSEFAVLRLFEVSSRD